MSYRAFRCGRQRVHPSINGLTMKHLVLALAVLLGSAGSVHAQSTATLDPPLTQQEQKNLEELRRQYRKGGYPAMTPEQEANFITHTRAKVAEMMGNTMAMQQVGSQLQQTRGAAARDLAAAVLSRSGLASAEAAAMPPSAPVVMDARTLATAMSQREGAAAFTQFEPRRDGFLYNGRAFVDASGEIVQYGADSATGNVSYLVQVAPATWQLKYSNVNASLPPMLLGQISSQGGVHTLQTVTGETSSGQNIVPTSKGAMVVRSGSVVGFDGHSGLRATALPEGFGVADLQQGDVSGTGFILLEREAEEQPASLSPLQRLRQVKDSLKSIVNDDSHDYALFSPATGQTVLLNVSAEGKKATFMDNCRRVNDVVNKCSTMDRRESLWDQDGTRNQRHYYWSAYWFNTASGPVAVARENMSTNISVYQLNTGRKVTAFHRGLGIGVWSVQPRAGGSVQVRASWPFNKQSVIEDVTTVFESGFITIQ
ncbi:MAG: hypothetical protein ACN6O2_06390 [Stenotrophomonas sp.]